MWEIPTDDNKAMHKPVNELVKLVCILRKCHSSSVHRHFVYKTVQSNKADTDRRLHPLCCHLGSYFKRPKSSHVRPLACNWYYCAQFVAMPKAACALSFKWQATSSNLGLWANMTSSIKPELYNVSLRRQSRTERWPQVTCTRNWWRSGVWFRRWPRTDKDTHRQER